MPGVKLSPYELKDKGVIQPTILILSGNMFPSRSVDVDDMICDSCPCSGCHISLHSDRLLPVWKLLALAVLSDE